MFEEEKKNAARKLLYIKAGFCYTERLTDNLSLGLSLKLGYREATTDC